jgi:AcrR family transcriptional regulator
VVASAMFFFARAGYFGATTAEIARAAGISQAYLYRLFENKEALFVAVLHEVEQRITQGIDEALANAPSQESLSTSLMRATDRLVAEAEASSVLLHAVAASQVPAIAEAVRDCYRHQVDALRRRGASDADIRSYFAWSQYANSMRAVGIGSDSSDQRDLVLARQPVRSD